jgi:manganese/zinc/iron transport system permease protein
LTDGLARLVGLAAGFGAASALSGYWLAYVLDASIAGSMATMSGVFFVLAWGFAPGRGLVAAARRRARQRLEFAQTMLAIHLANHEGTPAALEENRLDRLGAHLRWDVRDIRRVVATARRRGLVVERDGVLVLTERGRETARGALAV